MHQVKHNLFKEDGTATIPAALLPTNMFLHADLTGACLGEKLQFYDGTATLLGATAISIKICKRLWKITHIVSPLGHQISTWLYGIDLVECYKLWAANWGKIDENKIIFLTYKDAVKDEVE